MNKTTNIKKLVAATLATTAFALCAPTANAGMILTLFDGTTTKTIADGSTVAGANDLDLDSGSILFNGTIGLWRGRVVAGLSNSPVALGELALLEFSSTSWTNLAGFGGGSLTLTLFDDGFVNPVGANVGAGTTIGGTTTGTVTASSHFNGTTQIFLGNFNSPSFSGSGGNSVSTINPFTLTNSVTITHGAGSGTSTGPHTDFTMNTSIPEPATLGLLGLGLIGLGLARRKSGRGRVSTV